MPFFSVSLQDNTVVLTNKSNKKVLLRLVILHYQVTVITIDEERGSKTVSEEVKIEKEMKPNDKIELKPTIQNLKSVSVIFTVDDRTLREDIEI